MFLISLGLSTEAFVKTRIGLIQIFVQSFVCSRALSQAVFRKICATKSFPGGFSLIRISPFATLIRPPCAFVSIRKQLLWKVPNGRCFRAAKGGHRKSESDHRVLRAWLQLILHL